MCGASSQLCVNKLKRHLASNILYVAQQLGKKVALRQLSYRLNGDSASFDISSLNSIGLFSQVSRQRRTRTTRYPYQRYYAEVR